jgi:hypothetical protein
MPLHRRQKGRIVVNNMHKTLHGHLSVAKRLPRNSG